MTETGDAAVHESSRTDWLAEIAPTLAELERDGCDRRLLESLLSCLHQVRLIPRRLSKDLARVARRARRQLDSTAALLWAPADRALVETLAAICEFLALALPASELRKAEHWLEAHVAYFVYVGTGQKSFHDAVVAYLLDPGKDLLPNSQLKRRRRSHPIMRSEALRGLMAVAGHSSDVRSGAMTALEALAYPNLRKWILPRPFFFSVPFSARP